MKVHQIIYAIISFFTTQLLCIFLAQMLHTFYKSSPSISKFSDFPLLGLKFMKLLTSFLKQKVSFSSSLDLFSASWEIILLYFLSWNLICYWQKQHIKVQTFRLATAHIETHQIPYLIFGTKSQFFFKLSITLQCHEI